MQLTKSSITPPASLIVCVVVCVICVPCLICSVAVMISSVSSYLEGVEQRKVNATAWETRQNLYQPTDAVLLVEHQRDDFLAYGRNCTGTTIQLDYGVDRPIDEIIGEYHQALIEDGWELSPGYTKTDTYAFYQKGPELELQIGLPSGTFEKPSAYLTTYRVWIDYTIPEHARCTG